MYHLMGRLSFELSKWGSKGNLPFQGRGCGAKKNLLLPRSLAESLSLSGRKRKRVRKRAPPPTIPPSSFHAPFLEGNGRESLLLLLFLFFSKWTAIKMISRRGPLPSSSPQSAQHYYYGILYGTVEGQEGRNPPSETEGPLFEWYKMGRKEKGVSISSLPTPSCVLPALLLLVYIHTSVYRRYLFCSCCRSSHNYSAQDRPG